MYHPLIIIKHALELSTFAILFTDFQTKPPHLSTGDVYLDKLRYAFQIKFFTKAPTKQEASVLG